MKKFLKKFINNKHPLVMFYYRIKAILALMVYRYPSRKLVVIGVTGTDGKTTTSNLIAQTLENAGYKVGMTSTLKYKIAEMEWSNRDKMTTQSPFFIQKMLRQMVNAGCHYAVLEVTSIGVVQSRVYGINFDVAVITNQTEDHLDYHGSFESYMAAKGKFMGSIYSMRRKKNIKKVVILNEDDQHYEYYKQFRGDLTLTYGLQKGQIKGDDVLLKTNSTSFMVTVPNGSQTFETKLLGEFNVYNCLAAIAVGVSQGLSLESIAHSFKRIIPVGGRFEVVDVGQDFSVVVDYAHTSDALAKACGVFRGLTGDRRLILVFGATGGGRDKSKRPEMGKIADQFADIIILTDDDPYEEDRLEIIDQIAQGIKRQEGDRLFKIVDRVEAIKFACSLAKTGDTVLITGKGGEEVIVIGEDKIQHDDREVVRHFLSEKIYNNLIV